MRKKISLLLCLISLLFILTSCGTEPYEEKSGVVYQKEIKQEEKKIKEETDSNRKTHSYEYTYPIRYVVYVKYNIGKHKSKVYAFFVTKTIYDECDIGDEYWYNKVKDSLKEPYDSKTKVE